MSYRLLALDLDGTLLRDDQRVDERDVAAISELQASGVTVTIVTGRLQSGATGAAHACSIEGAIACVEGSHLVDLSTNTTLVHHALAGALAGQLRETLTSHQLASFVFDAGGIHHDRAGAPYAGYIRTWSPNIRVVEDDVAWQTAPLATVAIGDSAAVEAAHAEIRGYAEPPFSVSFAVSQCPGKHALLVRAGGPNKGTALAELCRLAGCTLAEAVAVGDWVNDIPMFQVAGRSFAMGESPEAVRRTATDVLSRVAGSGGGIAEAIQRAWG